LTPSPVMPTTSPCNLANSSEEEKTEYCMQNCNYTKRTNGLGQLDLVKPSAAKIQQSQFCQWAVLWPKQ